MSQTIQQQVEEIKHFKNQNLLSTILQLNQLLKVKSYYINTINGDKTLVSSYQNRIDEDQAKIIREKIMLAISKIDLE